jgi:hypothetical protein
MSALTVAEKKKYLSQQKQAEADTTKGGSHLAKNQNMNNQKMVQVRRTAPFKPTKSGLSFPLRMLFGFLPETIVIQKVPGGRYVINAILTNEELKKEKVSDPTISQAIEDVKARQKSKSVDKGPNKAN